MKTPTSKCPNTSETNVLMLNPLKKLLIIAISILILINKCVQMNSKFHKKVGYQFKTLIIIFLIMLLIKIQTTIIIVTKITLSLKEIV